MPIKIRAQKNVAGRSRDSTSTLTNDHLSEGFLLDPRKALQNEEVAQCFEHYLKSLSPWYDLTDCDSTFAAPVGTEAQHSPLLLSAIVAFAAIHRARTGHSAFMPLADAYHAQCLRLLIGLHDYDTATKDGTALAATCLLRSYEILGEEEDPNRHLFGAFSLIPALSSELPSERVLRAGLWNYLREDITFSLVNSCPLKVEVKSVNVIPCRDDDYANQITLLLARVINAVFLDEHAVVEQLRDAVAHWKSSLPFRPYHESTEGVFPRIRMIRDCQVAALHYYHVASMVLNQSEANAVDLEHHARVICGLAFSANSDAVLVNAYGPICYCGRWLTSGDERCEVVSRLLDSQKRTGWPVQSIIKKLKACWAGKDQSIVG